MNRLALAFLGYAAAFDSEAVLDEQLAVEEQLKNLKQASEDRYIHQDILNMLDRFVLDSENFGLMRTPVSQFESAGEAEEIKEQFLKNVRRLTQYRMNLSGYFGTLEDPCMNDLLFAFDFLLQAVSIKETQGEEALKEYCMEDMCQIYSQSYLDAFGTGTCDIVGTAYTGRSDLLLFKGEQERMIEIAAFFMEAYRLSLHITQEKPQTDKLIELIQTLGYYMQQSEDNFHDNLYENIEFYLQNYMGDSKEAFGEEMAELFATIYPNKKWLVNVFDDEDKVAVDCNNDCILFPNAFGDNHIVAAWVNEGSQPLEEGSVFPNKDVQLQFEDPQEVANLLSMSNSGNLDLVYVSEKPNVEWYLIEAPTFMDSSKFKLTEGEVTAYTLAKKPENVSVYMETEDEEQAFEMEEGSATFDSFDDFFIKAPEDTPQESSPVSE